MRFLNIFFRDYRGKLYATNRDVSEIAEALVQKFPRLQEAQQVVVKVGRLA